MAKDFYTTLGVAKTATEDEIKRPTENCERTTRICIPMTRMPSAVSRKSKRPTISLATNKSGNNTTASARPPSSKDFPAGLEARVQEEGLTPGRIKEGLGPKYTLISAGEEGSTTSSRISSEPGGDDNQPRVLVVSRASPLGVATSKPNWKFPFKPLFSAVNWTFIFPAIEPSN